MILRLRKQAEKRPRLGVSWCCRKIGRAEGRLCCSADVKQAARRRQRTGAEGSSRVAKCPVFSIASPRIPPGGVRWCEGVVEVG